MSKKLNITMNGVELVVKEGTQICELLSKAPHRGPHKELGAFINNHTVGLHYRLKSHATIETIDISRREGMDIYRRTASIILYAAAKDFSADMNIVVGQSIATGYFFKVSGISLDDTMIRELEARMHQIVKANISLNREWITIEEAVEIFRQQNSLDILKLIDQLKRAEVPVVTLCKYTGYGYGPIAHRTDVIDSFKLYRYEHGLVLDFPDEHGNIAEVHKPENKLFAAYLETKSWNELIHVENVADLNEHLMGQNADETVRVAEALHEKKIAAIADDIASRKNVRLVLIAGPSGSGKTTFSKRLSVHLKIHGLEPIAISIDSYYLDRELSPKHPDGSYNFECMEALDIELFNAHLKKLLDGEEVDIPSYSFAFGRRDPVHSKRMKLGRDQILITEGIHGLNETLTKAIPAGNKYKIYVSALTQLALDNHNRIFTTDTRLCRRIVRDRLFRGTAASETIAGWASVRAGERVNIFPYQEDADVMFNSALAYEHSLLKPYAERFLAEVPREHPSFMEAYRLAKFFSFFIPILPMEVPQTSILREFIGGSAFNYS